MGKIAIFMRKLDGFRFNAELYKLDPPFKRESDIIEYVAVSSVPSTFDLGKPETMVFKSDEFGNVLSWADLVQLIGEMNHKKALEMLGYEIVFQS